MKIENLSADQCLAGATSAITNAKSLIQESELLYSHHFYARAYALAHFSREELGKILMLVATGMRLISGVAVDWKKLDKRFRSHQKKIVNERLQSIVSLPAKYAVEAGLAENEETWLKLAMTGVQGAKYWEKRRNDSLYTDWDGSQFVEPSKAITSEQALRTRQLATLAIEDSARAISQLAFWLQVDPDEARSRWEATAAEIELPSSGMETVEQFLETVQKMHAAMIQINEWAKSKKGREGPSIPAEG